ncbi:MAG: hypothetical protein RL016_331, partial [Actinomycetota bacterium]
MSMKGVNDEEKIDLTKLEAKQLRARSMRLLGSLVRPVRRRLILSFSTVILSQAFRVLGPALIAYGIDQALPLAVKGDYVAL